MKTLATIIALFATPAAAICDKVVIHGLSYHTDRDLIEEVNELNYGLGCRLENVSGPLDAQFGAYRNSYDDTSVYGLADLTASNGLGVYMGIASGYNEPHTFDNGLTVIGGAVYQAEHFTVRATPSYNPRTEKAGAVIAVSLTF